MQHSKVKKRMRRDISKFKLTTRRFKFDNFRRYPGNNVVREDLLDLIMSGA